MSLRVHPNNRVRRVVSPAHPIRFRLVLALTLCAWVLPSTVLAGKDNVYWGPVGYLDLQKRLGAGNVPDGTGIPVLQVEASAGPTPASFKNQTITYLTANMSQGGSHADGIGSVFYGSASMTPGITQVGAMLSGNWYGSGFLKNNTPEESKSNQAVIDARVQNHSWISGSTSQPDSSYYQNILRRLDYTIRRDNTLVCVGVDNSPGMPALLGNCHNAIAVTKDYLDPSNGKLRNGSTGPTNGDVVGRSKPDIGVPVHYTSEATAVVSSACALLADAAADHVNSSAAGRVEVIKSALLSGATKEPMLNWSRQKPSKTATYYEPLSRKWGAGQINVNNSHLIITSDHQNGQDALTDDLTGWDYTGLAAVGDKRQYRLEIPHDVASAELSASINWLRRVAQPNDPPYSSLSPFSTENPTLSSLELRLYAATSEFLPGTLLDSSVSPIDNVQHLYQPTLEPGRRYLLEVTLGALPEEQASEDFGIAWQVRIQPIPEPNGGLLLLTAAGLMGVRGRGSTNAAT